MRHKPTVHISHQCTDGRRCGRGCSDGESKPGRRRKRCGDGRRHAGAIQKAPGTQREAPKACTSTGLLLLTSRDTAAVAVAASGAECQKPLDAACAAAAPRALATLGLPALVVGLPTLLARRVAAARKGRGVSLAAPLLRLVEGAPDDGPAREDVPAPKGMVRPIRPIQHPTHPTTPTVRISPIPGASLASMQSNVRPKRRAAGLI
eukprot:gene12440-biopygen25